MKYLAVLCLLIMVACGSDSNELLTRLLTEQKRLKDSTNSINEKIGAYLQKGMVDSVVAQKKQLGAVYARLTEIQSNIDSRLKRK